MLGRDIPLAERVAQPLRVLDVDGEDDGGAIRRVSDERVRNAVGRRERALGELLDREVATPRPATKSLEVDERPHDVVRPDEVALGNELGDLRPADEVREHVAEPRAIEAERRRGDAQPRRGRRAREHADVRRRDGVVRLVDHDVSHGLEVDCRSARNRLNHRDSHARVRVVFRGLHPGRDDCRVDAESRERRVHLEQELAPVHEHKRLFLSGVPVLDQAAEDDRFAAARRKRIHRRPVFAQRRSNLLRVSLLVRPKRRNASQRHLARAHERPQHRSAIRARQADGGEQVPR